MSKTWILGPCSIESESLFIECLSRINEIMKPDDTWYMKASFDKFYFRRLNIDSNNKVI